jgi:hypothetical protein
VEFDLNQPMDQQLPTRVADRFVAAMADRGIKLRFDIQSLILYFEDALQTHSIREAWMDVDGQPYHLKTGAGCYFGETLRRPHSGVWVGQLLPGPGNFYTVRIRFGEYFFEPFCWLSYRLSNGRSQGTVKQCVDAVLPSMTDGIDHKRRRIDAMIAERRVVVDNEVY